MSAELSRVEPDTELLWLLHAGVLSLTDIVMVTQSTSPDPVEQKVVYLNDAFEKITGYSCADALGKSPRFLLSERNPRSELVRIHDALKQNLPVVAELAVHHKNGGLLWLELGAVPIQQPTNLPKQAHPSWITTLRAITQRKVQEEQIESLAFYDPLTKLPNRQLLMSRLESNLASAVTNSATNEPAHRKNFALMFIDLDNFKLLNDTLGHATGDLVLQEVAIRLGASVRLQDTVARLGGDEFVVVLEHLSSNRVEASQYSKKVAEAILSVLSEPYNLTSSQYDGTCSIGITLFDNHAPNISELLKQADLAMYQAKAAGRNSICFFDPAMQAVVDANAITISELRQSLRKEDFVLHYQPQVAADGRMQGVEALIRWQHPERGLVYPDEFIAQAEESWLILPLGAWVLETACAQLASWATQKGTRHLRIAVNVSVRQFRQPEFVELVMMTMSKFGIDASRLQLELTESLLASGIDVTIAKMGMLKNAGVTLSIDDFGIGYSSLSHLKRLPLDQLKIDRAFVKDILTDPNDAAIARTIIGLAQSLGLGVIAEGVENEAQQKLLARFGCENYQGHLFCPALPIDALENFMSRQLPKLS